MRRGILATREELESLREKLARSPFDAIYARLQRRCGLILEAAPVTEQQWRALWQGGGWSTAQRAARIAQGRIWDLLIAHHVDPNRAFRDRAIEELRDLVRWRQWVDPCHNPLPADLCTAEAAATTAVALDWLWEDLAEADRLRALQAIRHKVFEPYRRAVADRAWWYTCYNNWNAVVNSGCGLAGLALGDDEPAAQEVLRLSRAGLKHFFAALGREGGWDEGLGYWGYAMRYLLLFGEAQARLVDDQRVFHTRGMDTTGLFGVYFTPNGQAASFGDHPVMPLYGALYLLVKHYGLRELTWWLDTYAFHGDVSTTDVSAAGLALLFRPLDAEAAPAGDLATVKVFHEIGWAAIADRWPRPKLYVAAKTGDLAANHAQHDMNAIQLQADGEMLLTDLGNPPLSREYLGETRSEFYEVQARAHNTLVVAERDHRLDAQGTIVEAQDDRRFRWVACDAAGACGENVTFIRHVIMLLNPRAQEGRMVVVLDEVTNSVPETVELFWHTAGKIQFDPRRRCGTIEGHRAVLHVALAATVPMKAAARTYKYRPGMEDRLLRVSAGVVGTALFVSAFSREPIREKIELKPSSTGLRLAVGGARLSFRALRRNLQLEKVTGS